MHGIIDPADAFVRGYLNRNYGQSDQIPYIDGATNQTKLTNITVGGRTIENAEVWVDPSTGQFAYYKDGVRIWTKEDTANLAFFFAPAVLEGVNVMGAAKEVNALLGPRAAEKPVVEAVEKSVLSDAGGAAVDDGASAMGRQADSALPKVAERPRIELTDATDAQGAGAPKFESPSAPKTEAPSTPRTSEEPTYDPVKMGGEPERPLFDQAGAPKAPEAPKFEAPKFEEPRLPDGTKLADADPAGGAGAPKAREPQSGIPNTEPGPAGPEPKAGAPEAKPAEYKPEPKTAETKAGQGEPKPSETKVAEAKPSETKAGDKAGAAEAPEKTAAGVEKSKGCSFTPDTPVLMADGALKPIGALRVGDLVASRNEFTGVYSRRPVTAVLVHDDPVQAHLAVQSERGVIETIDTTPEHPFYVEGQGFVRADALAPGMRIAGFAPHEPALHLVSSAEASGALLVRALALERKSFAAWNLTVAADHTFFVGWSRAWVHNSCSLDDLRGNGAKPLREGDYDTMITEDRLKFSKNDKGYYDLAGPASDDEVREAGVTLRAKAPPAKEVESALAKAAKGEKQHPMNNLEAEAAGYPKPPEGHYYRRKGEGKFELTQFEDYEGQAYRVVVKDGKKVLEKSGRIDTATRRRNIMEANSKPSEVDGLEKAMAEVPGKTEDAKKFATAYAREYEGVAAENLKQAAGLAGKEGRGVLTETKRRLAEIWRKAAGESEAAAEETIRRGLRELSVDLIRRMPSGNEMMEALASFRRIFAGKKPGAQGELFSAFRKSGMSPEFTAKEAAVGDTTMAGMSKRADGVVRLRGQKKMPNGRTAGGREVKDKEARGWFLAEDKSGPGAFDPKQAENYSKSVENGVVTAQSGKKYEGILYFFDDEVAATKALGEINGANEGKGLSDRIHVGYYDTFGELKWLR